MCIFDLVSCGKGRGRGFEKGEERWRDKGGELVGHMIDEGGDLFSVGNCDQLHDLTML